MFSRNLGKFAKINSREIRKVGKFAKISSREIQIFFEKKSKFLICEIKTFLSVRADILHDKSSFKRKIFEQKPLYHRFCIKNCNGKMLKLSEFAKISSREIYKISKFAKISSREMCKIVIREN